VGVTGAFRTRIGRVTLKNGGASLSIMRTPAPPNETMARVRKWLGEIASDKDGPPVAFVATAFWLNPEKPGSIGVMSSWHSDCWALPVVNLPETAMRHIRLEMSERIVQREIMESLGYDSEPPDAG
jgi:hypothetical protein